MNYSAHAITADVDVVNTAHAAEFFMSDGVVVTGGATGQAANVAEVKGDLFCVWCFFHNEFVSCFSDYADTDKSHKYVLYNDFLIITKKPHYRAKKETNIW